MNIGFDLDGSIANIDDEICHRLSKAGYKTDLSKWEHYFLDENIKGLDPLWLKAQFKDETFWLNAGIFDDAWFMCNKWFMEGHNIFFITCRDVRNFDVTTRWLEEWRINYNSLFCGAVKYSKNSYIDSLYLDIFIEDDPIEAKTLANNIPTFLLDRPYNSRYDIGGAVRVPDCYQINETLGQWLQDLNASLVVKHIT